MIRIEPKADDEVVRIVALEQHEVITIEQINDKRMRLMFAFCLYFDTQIREPIEL